MKSMVGLHEVDSGKIYYDGIDFTAMTNRERKPLRQEIGMLFQGGALFDSQTVEENVMFPLAMFSDMSVEERKERANFCLERVKLSHAHKLFPSEISGGMKKRVAIARAISMQPKYLFCDEPNSGLDPRTSIIIDNLIKEITEEFNITTIVITHDMNSVVEIGDTINFIYKGENIWQGDKESILKTDNQTVREFVYASKFVLSTRM
jgi:phospholipid/cholesterol/gamma-HCH transport system ATP-binding protein